MRAVDILSEEHELLLEVLDLFDELLLESAEDDRIDGETVAEMLAFLERFADGCHQDKEELVLFPVLAERTAGRARPLVGRLLRTHASERVLLEELRGGLEAAVYGDPVSRDTFLVKAREYADLQLRHAMAEERLLLPLAEQTLLPEDDAPLIAGFERVEAQLGCPGAAARQRSAESFRAQLELPMWYIPRMGPGGRVCKHDPQPA